MNSPTFAARNFSCAPQPTVTDPGAELKFRAANVGEGSAPEPEVTDVARD